VIRLIGVIYLIFPWSNRNLEDLVHKRGIDICHETMRLWWKPPRPNVCCHEPPSNFMDGGSVVALAFGLRTLVGLPCEFLLRVSFPNNAMPRGFPL
jgi:hypothetical protein